MCDSQTFCRNFSSHCESFYGCEILNYNMSYIYRYLCSKYKYSYSDWYSKDVNSMLNKICVEYTNHDYAIIYVKLF